MIKSIWQKIFPKKEKTRSHFTCKKGWYPREIFRDMVERERNRSNRTGSALSYMHLDLSKQSVSGDQLKPAEFEHFHKTILTIISNYTRLEDIKCVLSPKEIGILLVDTKRSGAELFFQKLSAKFMDYFEQNGNLDLSHFIHCINIYTYPMENFQPVDKFEVYGAEDKDSPVPKEKKAIKARFNKLAREKTAYRIMPNVQFKIRSFNDGVIALDKTDLWDTSWEDIKESLILGCKRCLDIVGALTGIFLFMPIALIISLAIKVTSKGPIYFRQKRIGQGSKEFNFLKFRSMEVDNDDSLHEEYVAKLIQGKNEEVNLGDDKQPVYKIKKDPRITSIGNFLRNTSLDELPQFINVLKGEMSLVGPRPPIPYEVKHYQYWHLQRIFKAKPGITGLWQLYGRSVCTFDEMVRYDLQYIDQFSLWLDLKIIYKTLFVFMRQNGAL